MGRRNRCARTRIADGRNRHQPAAVASIPAAEA
jgi:hypothetical protein